MQNDTLLAHLADRFVTQRENLATETLTYLLSKPPVAQAFQRHLARFCHDLEPVQQFTTQQSGDVDSGIPDIAGFGSSGTPNLLVEAKFAAGLTAHQPVTYIHRLSATSSPGLLLFVVPLRRAESVWHQIQQRCTDDGVVLTIAEPSSRIGISRSVTVAVTTWSHLLDDLEAGLNPTDHRAEIAELAQLRGLCEREDQESFTPLTNDELGGRTGQRLLQLNTLLVEAVDIVKSEGLADLRGLRWSSGEGWFGRYLKLSGWIVLLHVNFRHWGRLRATPLWLSLHNHDQRSLDALAPLLLTQPPRLLTGDGTPCIPIELPAGVDRDQVLNRILSQLREIHDLLPPIPFPQASDTPAE